MCMYRYAPLQRPFIGSGLLNVRGQGQCERSFIVTKLRPSAFSEVVCSWDDNLPSVRLQHLARKSQKAPLGYSRNQSSPSRSIWLLCSQGMEASGVMRRLYQKGYSKESSIGVKALFSAQSLLTLVIGHDSQNVNKLLQFVSPPSNAVIPTGKLSPRTDQD